MNRYASIALVSSLLAGASAFAPAPASRSTTKLFSDASDDYWDPLMLSQLGKNIDTFPNMFPDQQFVTEAEIKHGRVAMAAFVGYCIQSNVVFTWPQTTAGDLPPSVDLLPEQQWDAIPDVAKWQIVTVIGFLEFWDEVSGEHYMRGRQPGKYPSLDYFRKEVHWVPDLYDPLGFNKKMSDETKKRRLAVEINNGRLAMLGIFGFLTADKIPGSVPVLGGIASPYDGEPMIPW